MKRYICLIISIILCFPLMVYSDVSEYSTNKVMYIDLETAFKWLDKNNKDIQLMNDKVVLYEDRYKKSKEKSILAANLSSIYSNSNIQYRKDELLNWQLNKLELDDVQNELINLREHKQTAVKKLYMEGILFSKEKSILDNELYNINKKIEELKIKIRLGQAKESDQKLLVSQKLMINNQINETNRQLTSTLMNLKKELGIDLSTQLILEAVTLEKKAFDDGNIQEQIGEALKESLQIAKITKRIELKELERQIIVKNTHTPAPPDVFDLDISIKELKTQLAKESVNVESDLWIEYYDVLILEENMGIEEANLELEKLNFDLVSTKAKLGMVDSVTELSAIIAYDKQKLSLQRAINNYVVAVEQLYEKLNIEK